MSVYVSGALTGVDKLDELKRFYEAIGRVCNEVGWEAYVPHLRTDPVSNPDISPEQVFLTDKQHVLASDLLIAYIGVPSTGVGMELAYADVSDIPIVLLYEDGKTVSRFPRGIPNIIAEIVFQDYEHALAQIKTILLEVPNRKSRDDVI